MYHVYTCTVNVRYEFRMLYFFLRYSIMIHKISLHFGLHRSFHARIRTCLVQSEYKSTRQSYETQRITDDIVHPFFFSLIVNPRPGRLEHGRRLQIRVQPWPCSPHRLGRALLHPVDGVHHEGGAAEGRVEGRVVEAKYEVGEGEAEEGAHGDVLPVVVVVARAGDGDQGGD